MRGEGGEALGGGGVRDWKRRRGESGEGRGRPVGVEADREVRGDGGMTDRESDEPNIDWRGEAGALVAGDRADMGAASVVDVAVTADGCCRSARAAAVSDGSAGGRAVCPSRVFASACRAIANAAAERPETSSWPAAGVISIAGAVSVACWLATSGISARLVSGGEVDMRARLG